jgi:hypothetical protein
MTADYKIENIHIFVTNIQTSREYECIKPVLDLHKGIEEWNIDMEDVDRVLRVTSTKMTDEEIIHLLSQFGVLCRELK